VYILGFACLTLTWAGTLKSPNALLSWLFFELFILSSSLLLSSPFNPNIPDIFIMQYKTLATLFFAATALAAPATDSTSDYSDLYDTSNSDDSYDLADVPTSILTVLATAIPDSWYSDILDPSSRDSIISAAAAGTYPAWYNSLPSSVKAWATSNFDDELLGASSTVDSSATQTESAGSTASKTGSSSAIETGSSSGSSSAAAGVSTTATQTSSNAAETSSSSTSDSSSDSSSSASASASASASSSQSTGGAPAPTGGVAIGVASAAGILAFALAL
jgi:hypothetical protein